MKKKLSKKKRKEIMKQFGGRMPTKKEIFEKIKASQERMIAALKGAYETAPQDPKIRSELMEAIEKATKLRSKIYKDLIKEEVPKKNISQINSHHERLVV